MLLYHSRQLVSVLMRFALVRFTFPCGRKGVLVHVTKAHFVLSNFKRMAMLAAGSRPIRLQGWKQTDQYMNAWDWSPPAVDY